MNLRTPFAKVFATSALVLAGAAQAQDNSGADRPTTAPATESSGAKANGVYPAPTQGVEQGVPAGKRVQATRTTHASKHKPHHAKKPTNGAMNAPGGGSDAKGQ
jgi:hypothetical protein